MIIASAMEAKQVNPSVSEVNRIIHGKKHALSRRCPQFNFKKFAKQNEVPRELPFSSKPAPKTVKANF